MGNEYNKNILPPHSGHMPHYAAEGYIAIINSNNFQILGVCKPLLLDVCRLEKNNALILRIHIIIYVGGWDSNFLSP